MGIDILCRVANCFNPKGCRAWSANLNSISWPVQRFCSRAWHFIRSSILQQQQHPDKQETPPAPRQLWEVATLPEGFFFDAVLTIGSPIASQMLLSFLRRAQAERKARLPVMVQYLVPGLWDFHQTSHTAATWANGRPPLLMLLPGTTESEVRDSMAAFDSLTRALQQHHPRLAAAMVLPDLLVDAAVEATTKNFAISVVVIPSGSTLSSNAAAAASAAICHPGTSSLTAVAGGVPLVCVRPGSVLVDGFKSWLVRKQLPFGCVPNLVLGKPAVPEYRLWEKGSMQAAVDMVGSLLSDETTQAGQTAKAAAGAGGGARASQRVVLQQVLLELLPVSERHLAASGGASSSTGFTLKASEAAAQVLLDLVRLRKQQEADQVQKFLAAKGSMAA
eukprot:gene5155-5395_t